MPPSALDRLGCPRYEELEAIGDVALGRAAFEVNADEVGIREAVAQLAHRAASRDVVGQAPEGLQTHHIVHARGEELGHLGRQQPAFARLLSGVHEALDALKVGRELGHGRQGAR